MFYPSIHAFQGVSVLDSNNFDDSHINFKFVDFDKRNTDIDDDIETDELATLRDRCGSTSSDNSNESGDSYESATTSNGRYHAHDMHKYLFPASHPVSAPIRRRLVPSACRLQGAQFRQRLHTLHSCCTCKPILHGRVKTSRIERS
eukprot:1490914-Pyramimonas_sp.AAC.2